MWLGGGGGGESRRTKGEIGQFSSEVLFVDLYQEVKSAAPSANLSYSLRSRLERIHEDSRKEIASRVKDGVSPLFIACKKGNVEIVEYLLETCGADCEQKGLYQVPDDNSVHRVSPLWVASVAGKASVVQVLAKYGADVNSQSDTGSTPVRSACFMTHLEIVKILVEYRADILTPNYNGGTCLINSVQSLELCEFLLSHGADVNAVDIQNKTALHYAIQEHRFLTTKLLLQYGANPYLLSRYKDDALQTACLKGASEIFEYLIDHLPYSPSRVASAYELLGSTILDEHHDSQKAFDYWKAAIEVREKFSLIKNVNPLTYSHYKYEREFSTREELESVSLNLEALRIQSLLICERILGSNHKDMIYRLMYRGAAAAASLQYQSSIDLWKYALKLRILKDGILYPDTVFTAQALVKLYLDLLDKVSEGLLVSEVGEKDVQETLELLLESCTASAPLLEIRPLYQKYQESFDKALGTLMNLLYYISQSKNLESKETMNSIKKSLHSFVSRSDLRTSEGKSLLHLSVSCTLPLKSPNLFDSSSSYSTFFPSIDVTRLLLECGSSVKGLDASANTPLHIASEKNNYRTEIVELLLEYGSHIDSKNAKGNKASTLLKANPNCKISAVRYMSLKCFAASVIAQHGLLPHSLVPRGLEAFIESH